MLYSAIISSEDYIRTISDEHLYISASDQYIKNLITKKVRPDKTTEIVELGCGPGRLLPSFLEIKNIKLTGVDIDPIFLEHARNRIKDKSIQLTQADITTYKHPKKVDIFFSQGVHHHIKKGENTVKYLQNIVVQLADSGFYILSDEFIPDYRNETERKIKLVIWYSHIISHARKSGYTYLAQEEAKTLLDDIMENEPTENFKTKKQIEAVLNNSKEINEAAECEGMEKATNLSISLLKEIGQYGKRSEDKEVELAASRHDFKICDQVFRGEIIKAGLVVDAHKSFGPFEHIGGMVVYSLKKA